MIIPERVQCDICKATKEESNGWTVALESVKPGSAHLTFAESREVFRDPSTGELPGDAFFSDLCGQECAHTQLSRWFESHSSAPTATSESENQ
ncbi:MAG: hypothetical protein ACYCSP_06060 [Acidobacteriaceae bacterium]